LSAKPLVAGGFVTYFLCNEIPFHLFQNKNKNMEGLKVNSYKRISTEKLEVPNEVINHTMTVI